MSSQKKGWRELPLAGVCWKPSTEYLTGDWRTFKPVVDHGKCTLCLLCHLYCPDGTIKWNREAKAIEFDYDHCKGCGICAEECPVGAIQMVRE